MAMVRRDADMPMARPLLLTVDEVAAELRLNRATVYENLIRTGALRSIRIGGRARRVAMRDLEEYIERLRAGDTGDQPPAA